MTRLSLILNNFGYYLRANILVIIGVAISTAVLTGSLIIGDSVSYSLEKSAFYRLGTITHAVSSTDRYFREELAQELAQQGEFIVVPALILDGMAVAEGGNERINKVQIIGINDSFEKIATAPIYRNISGNDVLISENLADRLHLKQGDNFIVRIKKASLIPLNAPFVSDAETNVSFQATVKGITGQKTLGFFNLKNVQTAPYNLFLSLSKLNSLMKFEKKANRLLISAPSATNQHINELLDSCFTSEDAGLKIRNIALTNETDITSDRIFIEDQIIKALKPLDNSRCIMTYFANSLEINGKSTPYSFVSTIDDKFLNNNDIIINSWLADDLNAKTGDSLTVKYFVIGPLRQLVEKGEKFAVRKIVPIKGKYGDRDLMPLLPGLSNAGHCRDWEAGVPIKLGAIRPTDEAYWNKYKGTPKAFISLSKAHQIWSNRFGNFTAIRIDNDAFIKNSYKSLFAASVKPVNLGIIVTSVKENGLLAARNGVDFSQLFMGLSFFLLVASVILTALLLLLNLESRRSELGSLIILGFTRNQIRRLYLTEGLILAVIGGLFGLLLSVIYIKLIFLALNTLWWDAVRTSALDIDLRASALSLGLIISIFISLLTVVVAIQRSFKKQAVELQRQQDIIQKPFVRRLKLAIICLSVIPALGFVLFQLIYSQNLNSVLFFLSGGLLLLGLLFIADDFLHRNREKVIPELSFSLLNQRNRSQKTGRSLTILILFAIGTFLVISTGANRGDQLFDGSAKKSGTGGFKYFAETSVPVLFSLNDKDQRVKEGILTSFNAAEFNKIDGDDASCLNLNRTSNPSILGADPNIFNDRFTFDTKCPEIGDKQIWKSLNDPLGEYVVPAMADQSVIQWGLGKNIGDTLIYQNEFGRTIRLKLIGGLSSSVFQGYVLISNGNFLKNFPTTSGSHLFLIDVLNQNAEKVGEELRSTFRDYGWEMTTTGQRLMEFNSVENTYLSIFLALGALGLILGTVGLAVVLARTLLERKNEIILMLSLGFTRRQIISLLFQEYAFLLIWGVVTGFLASAVAVLPNFLSAGGKASFLSVLLIVTIIILNGVIWIFVLSRLGTRHSRLSFNTDI